MNWKGKKIKPSAFVDNFISTWETKKIKLSE